MKRPDRTLHLWPGGWFRFFLLGLALLNLWVSYEVWFRNPVLAIFNVIMAVVLLLVLAASWFDGERP